ncbi:hypothetical protein AB0M64_29975 [Streptomyces sp. NPDC051771]|uniref:hypothetical protein n=1 Tax=Streptomyces sp. NPDC051771 TaxID=3154847 RepID=UPI00342C7F20
MSLLVHTFVLDADGRREILESPPGGGDLAGFESTRAELWGSPGMRALGARFFPRLDGDDLHVEPEEVEDFLAECETVRPHLADLAGQGGYAPDYVAVRFGHIVAAAHRAREVGGGVLVW